MVRTDRLGDVILTLPLLPILRRFFPKAHLAMLLGRYAGEVVEGNPWVDELLWYDAGGAPVPFGRMLRTLREKKFDACVVVHPTGRIAALMFLAGIPLRVGTGYRLYSLLFNRRVYTHRKVATRHEIEYNLDLLKGLGREAPAGMRPDFTVMIPGTARGRVEQMLAVRGIAPGDRYVVIHPGSGGSARDWPLENFGELADLLSAREGVRVVVTGGAGEAVKVETVVRRSGGKAVGLAGEFSLKELAALIQRGALFISNSTGPLHLAVAVGTPVLGFYPQIPVMGVRRWGPSAEKARVLVPERPIDCSLCTGKAGEPCPCMSSITVDAAGIAAASLLSASPVVMGSSGA